MNHQNSFATLLHQILARYEDKNSYYTDYSRRGFEDQQIKVTFDATAFPVLSEAGKLTLIGQGTEKYSFSWYYARDDDEGKIGSENLVEISLVAYADETSLAFDLLVEEDKKFYLGTFLAQEKQSSVTWKAQDFLLHDIWCREPMPVEGDVQSVLENYPFLLLRIQKLERLA